MKKLKLNKKLLKRKRTDEVMHGAPLHYNAAVAAKYKKALDKHIEAMSKEVKREFKKLFETKHAKDFFDTADASIASQARMLLNALNKKFTQLFLDLSVNLAETMVSGVDNVSKNTLKKSLTTMTGIGINTAIQGKELSNVIKASLTANVDLIRSIPTHYFTQITGEVMRSVTSGQGLYDLLPAIERYKGVTKRRAKTIAYDQTRKAYNSINKARMQKVGINKFMWHHSHAGLHPRKLHERMDGNIYSFDDLPTIDERTGERGIPGQAVNCKCFMSPVLEFDND